jgi:hypothetical protein
MARHYNTTKEAFVAARDSFDNSAYGEADWQFGAAEDAEVRCE